MRRLSRSTVIVLAATALAVLPAAVAGGSPTVAGTVTPNSRLTSDKSILRGHDIPGLAVDPADPRHIVLVEEDYLNGQCDYHTSFDGGQTWTDGVLTVPSDFADPPCRTFDSGGYAHFNQSVAFGTGQSVYTTFASHRGAQERPEIKVVQGEGDSVIVNRSTDGGRTFQTGVVAIHGSPMSQPYVIRPGIAVQPRASGDRLLAEGWSVFVTSGGAQGGGGDRQLVTSVSDDGGMTWSAPVAASAPGEHVREPAPPVIASDGTMYVAWRNRDAPSTAPHPLVVAKSTDGGQTWTRSEVAQMLPAPAGSGSAAGYPRLAIDQKTNTVYVVYRNFTPAGNVDVYVQHTTDGAATWSAPVQVNDDSGKVDHVGQEIEVAPSGRVDVAWLDYRNAYPTPADLKAAQEGNIYYASSSDGGQTFSANRRISDRSINLDDGLSPRDGSYIWWTPALAALGNSGVLFAWSDSRLGNVDNDNDDIELATLQLTSGAPAAVQALPSASPSNESVAASQLAYPAGAERIGSAGRSQVVIAPDNDPASALAGAVLARASFGPLLLSPQGGLTKNLRDEVARLRPSGAYLVGTSSTALASVVERQLATAGVTKVTRLQSSTPEGMAAAVAAALDIRDGTEKGASMPAAAAAVIVNPTAADAAAGVGLAAALRYPVLFASQNALPATTTGALSSLAIPKAIVVGSTGSIGDSPMGQLSGATRVSGSDASDTSVKATAMAAAGGVPSNVAWIADPARPADAAVAAASAARVGALEVLAPGADPAVGQRELASLQLGTVDQVVQVKSKGSAGANTALIVLFAVLGVVGLFLLLASRALSRRSKEQRAAPVRALTGSGAA